ncbi:MAG: hypothetical protein RQ899_07650 [Pseudomonadales bacterium]|nr:hypothetical protein [Pseudomonadales bacterium]
MNDPEIEEKARLDDCQARTRAMHVLNLIAVGAPSHFLPYQAEATAHLAS